MGWTSMQKPENFNTKKFFEQEFNSDKHLVLDCKVKNRVAYIALKLLKENKVVAVVCILDFKNGEFAYKDMDETVGPCYYDCPESILKLLTEPLNDYSKAWREKCKARINNKLEEGSIIKFVEKFSFQSGAYNEDTFKVISTKPQKLQSVSFGFLTKIPNLKSYNYTVL
jgi:transcriptional regulatory protein LevR